MGLELVVLYCSLFARPQDSSLPDPPWIRVLGWTQEPLVWLYRHGDGSFSFPICLLIQGGLFAVPIWIILYRRNRRSDGPVIRLSPTSEC
jgi:hypothetical protein